MKRLLIVIMILLICLPSIYARKKKPKSGKIKDNVYTDATHNFQLTLFENWDTDLQKPKSNRRLVLKQKDHEIPPALMQYPLKTKVPGLEVFHVQVPFKPDVLIDSLTSETYSSGTKKEVLEELIVLDELTIFDGFRTVQKRGITIDEKNGYYWEGIASYQKDLGMGEFDPRSYSVLIVAIANGDNMLVFVSYCEVMFSTKIYTETSKIIESLKWE